MTAEETMRKVCQTSLFQFISFI